MVRISPKNGNYDKVVVESLDVESPWSVVDQWVEITAKAEKSK